MDLSQIVVHEAINKYTLLFDSVSYKVPITNPDRHWTLKSQTVLNTETTINVKTQSHKITEFRHYCMLRSAREHILLSG
jgi:hypothetical protein